MIIDPSKRFNSIKDYPKTTILYHSKRYNPIISEIPVSKDFHIEDAEVGCTETHKRMVENYFKGSRFFINVGACGAISSGLKIGDIVEATSVLCSSGFSNFFGYGDILFCRKKFPEIIDVCTQCVPTMYYEKTDIHKEADCIEQESEAVLVTVRWLNEKYGRKMGACGCANLFYISDIIDRNEWIDTLKLQDSRNIYRKDVLFSALHIYDR